MKKRILFFTGGRGKLGKENFAHTAQLYLALNKEENFIVCDYDKKKIFSWDFFSKKNNLIVSVGFLSFYFVLMRKMGLIKCKVLHSWNDDYHKCGGFGGKWLRKKIEYWTVKNADYNLTCSKYRLEISRKLKIPRNKINFIPHGVLDDWDKIKPKKLKRLNIIYMGELSDVKGSEMIINLAKKFPELNFHFFGRVKKGQEKLIKNLPRNINFHGWMKNEEAISYCKGADVLLHPTDNDSTLKIHNYIKCGKAIIALSGQIDYLLNHKENSYITNDFQKGLNEILRNKELKKNLIEGVKKIKICSWSEIRKRYLKFIKGIL